MYNNELMHYGVLGMKWGMHRAQKKGTTYKYKSYSTKKYNRKAKNAKESAKEWDEMARYAQSKGKTEKANKYKQYASKDRSDAAKYERRMKRSAKLDANEQKIAKQTKTGKVLATRLLTGGIGAKSYQRYQAMGNSKAKAFVKTALLGDFHRIQKAIYIRSDD